MSLIAWIVLGLISGFIASLIVRRAGSGFLLDVGLGVVGAVLGGFLFSLAGGVGVTGLNLWSVFVAVIGAVCVLAVGRAVGRTA